MRQVSLVLLLGLLLLGAAPVANAQNLGYSVQELPPVTNCLYSTARAINDQGQVAGNSTDVSNKVHATLWSKGQPPKDLGDLGGGQSFALGISDAGEVVGWSTNSNNQSRAFLYAGGISGLAPTDYTSTAWAISSPGVVGSTGDYPYLHPCKFGADPPVSLGKQSYFGEATAIKGLIIAGYVYGAATKQHTHAAILYEGDHQDLGTLGGLNSTATGVNLLGQVVGSANIANDIPHAVLWQGGTPTDLMLGQGSSAAYAINLREEVVGTANPDNGPQYAFYWKPGEVMQDLNTLIPYKNYNDPGHWTLTRAYGINDKGQIVGEGSLGYPGKQRGFLLTPITPEALDIACIIIMLLLSD